MGGSEALSAQLSESVKLASTGCEAEAASLSVEALQQAVESAHDHDGGSLAECVLLIIWEHLGAQGDAVEALLDSIQMDVLPQILALAAKSEDASKLCCMLMSRVVSSCTPRQDGCTSTVFSLLLYFLQVLPGLLSRISRRQRECAISCLTPVANLAAAVANYLGPVMEAVGIKREVQADSLSLGFTSRISAPEMASAKASQEEDHLAALLLSNLAPFVVFTRDVYEMCTKGGEDEAVKASAREHFACFCLHVLSCLALQTPEDVLLSSELSGTLKQAMGVLQEALSGVEGPQLVHSSQDNGPLNFMRKAWNIALAADKERSDLPINKLPAGASLATFLLLARADDAALPAPELALADADQSNATRIDFLSVVSDMATALFSQGEASNSPQAIQKAVTLLDMAGAWAASCAKPVTERMPETKFDADLVTVTVACHLFSSGSARGTSFASSEADDEDKNAKEMSEKDAALQVLKQLAASPASIMERGDQAAVSKISRALQVVGVQIATCVTDHQRAIAFKSMRSVFSGLPPAARLLAIEQVVVNCPSHDFVSLVLQVLQQHVLGAAQRPGTLQCATFVSPATLKLVLHVLRDYLDDPKGYSRASTAPSAAQTHDCKQDGSDEKGVKEAADLFQGRTSEAELVARADALAAALNLLHVMRMLCTRRIRIADHSRTSQTANEVESNLLPTSVSVVLLLEHHNPDALLYTYVHAICKAAVEKLHAQVEVLVLRDCVLAVGVQLPVAVGPSTVGGAPQDSDATLALTKSGRLGAVPSAKQQAEQQATNKNAGLKHDMVMRHIALARLEEASQRLVTPA
eukprot:gene27584-7219_t